MYELQGDLLCKSIIIYAIYPYINCISFLYNISDSNETTTKTSHHRYSRLKREKINFGQIFQSTYERMTYVLHYSWNYRTPNDYCEHQLDYVFILSSKSGNCSLLVLLLWKSLLLIFAFYSKTANYIIVPLEMCE